MAGNVVFQNLSLDVKTELNDTTIAWLYTWAAEIEAHAKRHCSKGESYSNQLRGNYQYDVDENKGEAKVGNPLEQVYWEEYGTGEYADTSKNGGKKGRKGWWVYKDGYTGKGGPVLTEAQAKAKAAASDGSVHATNGRKPNYTLEKAFKANTNKAVKDLENQLGVRLGK